ncbi:MAG: type II secretion system protein [Lentisphaeraceae bacterium]|nr:type II secretion system protein [Lentisphaeraceae bacterium]
MKLNQVKKFTLIELLIVVAIIGILATMLLPSLSKAIKTSRKAVCTNNLKTLGTGMSLFLLNGNSEEKIKKGYYPTSELWARNIATLLGDTLSGNNNSKMSGAYWQCPSPQRSKWPKPLGNGKISYGMNSYLTFWRRNTGYERYRTSPTVPQSQIVRPSDTVLFAASDGDGSRDHYIGGVFITKAWHGGATAGAAFIDGHTANHSVFLLNDHSSAPHIGFSVNW